MHSLLALGADILVVVCVYVVGAGGGGEGGVHIISIVHLFTHSSRLRTYLSDPPEMLSAKVNNAGTLLIIDRG